MEPVQVSHAATHTGTCVRRRTSAHVLEVVEARGFYSYSLVVPFRLTALERAGEMQSPQETADTYAPTCIWKHTQLPDPLLQSVLPTYNFTFSSAFIKSSASSVGLTLGTPSTSARLCLLFRRTLIPTLAQEPSPLLSTIPSAQGSHAQALTSVGLLLKFTALSDELVELTRFRALGPGCSEDGSGCRLKWARPNRLSQAPPTLLIHANSGSHRHTWLCASSDLAVGWMTCRFGKG
ncbi:unnamed protein product [Protopolystoma xenopodis]|uniref:Uncharacterized protein n=1 Tax=Protopolystoma xenopodis TaxID=117903 RepID=A0A3S5A6N7_9PLAT|nr:unnamed protein product [Protopolystoma xenopodis]